MRFVLTAVVLVSFVACGDDSPAGGGTCEDAWAARCARACECQPGPQCTFAGGRVEWMGDTRFALGTVITSEEGCLQASIIECGPGDNPKADYPLCVEQTRTASCAEVNSNGETFTGVVPVGPCIFN